MSMKRARRSALVLAVLFLCACQPTPSEEVVLNRSDMVFEKAVTAPALDPYRYEAPAEWKEEIPVKGGGTITVDATVELGDSLMHPVYTVEAESFTGQVKDILERLFGTDCLIRKQAAGYQELLFDLFIAERGYMVSQDEETGEIIWGPYPEQEEDIARIKEQLANTPLEDEFVPLTEDRTALPLTNRCLRTSGGDWYITGNGNFLSLSIVRYGCMQPESIVKGLEGGFIGEKPHALENIHITEQDAVAAGNAFIQKLQRSELQLASVQKGRLLESWSHETAGEGYLLHYVPCVDGGVPVCHSDFHYCDGIEFAREDVTKTYNRPIKQETVELLVTEDGVIAMCWDSPMKTVLTANENVALLPFSEIQNRIRKNWEYGYGQPAKVTIIRIILTGSLKRMMNQKSNEALLSPVWTIVTEIDGGGGYPDVGMYMMSAIDGSFVSRIAD